MSLKIGHKKENFKKELNFPAIQASEKNPAWKLNQALIYEPTTLMQNVTNNYF